MSYLQFVLAFVVLAGIALLWAKIMRMSIGEGMVLAVISIIGAMYLSGYIQSFRTGKNILLVLGLVGWAIYIGSGVNKKRSNNGSARQLIFTPYLCCAFILMLIYMVLYYKDFIQHIDEFHLWAPAVRYMLQKNALPIGTASYDTRQLIGTSFFHVFFQYFTGYSEAFMYVSATLLSMLGLMLPFGNFVWNGSKEEKVRIYKQLFLYLILMVLAIYSLYVYGLKNLYVDVPCAAWAGGIAAWWTLREKNKKSNILVLLAGMTLVYVFKAQVGALMVLILALWVLAWNWVEEGTFLVWNEKEIARYKKPLICIGILIVSGLVILTVLYLKIKVSSVGIDTEKVKKMIVRFITSIFGKSLSGRGNLSISFLSCFMLIEVLFIVGADLARNKRRKATMIIYSMLILLGYLSVLVYAYSFIFSYEESVKVAGITRYLSIPIIFLLILAINFIMQQWTVSRTKTSITAKYIILGLIVFWGLGVNETFIPSMTGIDKPHISGYGDLHAAKEQIKQIKKEIKKTDKVYMLNQMGESEYPVNVASYELEDQINNYLVEPWRFTEEGCEIRLKKYEEPTITDFKKVLDEGDYSYVWVFTTDKYLTQNLPQIMHIDARLADAQLYKVMPDENGNASYLKLVVNLEETDRD